MKAFTCGISNSTAALSRLYALVRIIFASGRMRAASAMTLRLDIPGRVKSSRIASMAPLFLRNSSIATEPSGASATRNPFRRKRFATTNLRPSSSSTKKHGPGLGLADAGRGISERAHHPARSGYP